MTRTEAIRAAECRLEHLVYGEVSVREVHEHFVVMAQGTFSGRTRPARNSQSRRDVPCPPDRFCAPPYRNPSSVRRLRPPRGTLQRPPGSDGARRAGHRTLAGRACPCPRIAAPPASSSAWTLGLAPQEPLPFGNASCPSPSRPGSLSAFGQLAPSEVRQAASQIVHECPTADDDTLAVAGQVLACPADTFACPADTFACPADTFAPAPSTWCAAMPSGSSTPCLLARVRPATAASRRPRYAHS